MAESTENAPAASPVRGAKRQRVEDGSDQQEVAIVQSDKLWLDDGNLVVRTTSKGPPPMQTLYKIHKRVLALHCSAFASLFDGPQAAFDIGSQQHEGVPVMDLPDPPEDVHDFLMALYFPMETHRHSPITSPVRDGRWNVFPRSYHGILRLAVKYDSPDIRDLFADLMRANWPSVLKDWEFLRAQLKACPVLNIPGHRRISPIDAIVLAVECQISDVLPVAFYELSCIADTLRPSDDLDKQRADYTKSLSMITPDQLIKLTIGKGLLKGHLKAFIHQFKSDLLSGACGCMLGTCMNKVLDWWSVQEGSGFSESDPLVWLHTVVVSCDNVHHRGICDVCQEFIKKVMVAMKEEVWGKLPDFFGLRDVVSETWGAVAPA
ncbi:hypothetical protein BV25DRAFT_353004 [Artomyces pyxidatus]|uniref:Uncharacterized protein n=1 Tax=Artomyces pyxidatus TaxID=48021 RepID=A0ACB8SEK1_9AGAM|nr:hypothetical protein BV25DRAFT_353004 [Artomyces pyxidatus]